MEQARFKLGSGPAVKGWLLGLPGMFEADSRDGAVIAAHLDFTLRTGHDCDVEHFERLLHGMGYRPLPVEFAGMTSAQSGGPRCWRLTLPSSGEPI